MILKNKVRETIDFIQTKRVHGRINHELIDEINIKLREIKSIAFNSSISVTIKDAIENLIIESPGDIEKKLNPINFWNIPSINKWGGSLAGFIFSNKQLPIKKYIMLNSFQLEKILRLLK